MAKKILIGIVALLLLAIVGFVVVVAMQPSELYVSRSTNIDAPPGKVFPHVNNFHKWQEWSPWAKRDPNAEYSFVGPESGKDAEMHWDGNDDVGAGFMKITESRPDELVRYDLYFIRPYEDSCEVEFRLEPQGGGTQVTWVMEGENNFAAKAMCLFMDVEAMIAKDYDKGLANLKQVVEAEADASGANEAMGEEADSDENNSEVVDSEG